MFAITKKKKIPITSLKLKCCKANWTNRNMNSAHHLKEFEPAIAYFLCRLKLLGSKTIIKI